MAVKSEFLPPEAIPHISKLNCASHEVEKEMRVNGESELELHQAAAVC